MEAKQMQLQNFFIFLMDCICIVLSYILASYLRFGNLWGGYTKGIVLLRMGILLMSITLVYFIFNPTNWNLFVQCSRYNCYYVLIRVQTHIRGTSSVLQYQHI